jgi:oligoendopeptidase F
MATMEELTGAEDVAWNLDDLYTGAADPAFERDVAEAESGATAFRARYHQKVASLDAEELAAAIAERERIDSVFTRAAYFSHLQYSTNVTDPERGALVAKLTEKGAALETQLLFFTLEIAALDDAAAERLLAAPGLSSWKHWVEEQRALRPHLLSEPEEKIITEKSVPGVSAWSRLFEEQVAALRVSIDGEELSLESALSRLHRSDRDVRRATAEAMGEALAPGLRTRAYIFNTILVDKAIEDRLRGFPTWLSARNLSNETTDEAVEALVQAVVSRYDVTRRYYRLKAKLLGVDRIAHYDRFAPVAEDTSRTSWDEARTIVREAYHSFAPEAGAVVDRFFDEDWIDGPVRENKRTGAFCATNVPGVHPYILMNYTGERRSILTLAHELGHGLHGMLAQPLGLYNASTPLTTAETASVFGESLTFKRLMAGETDPQRRLSLITGRLEDGIATVFRQIAMNRFEHAIHTERREQGELSPDRFNEIWLAEQARLFGEAVDIEGYGPWWSYVHHFTASPGYVYAYAYGFLFSLTIFRKYELEGDSMVEPTLELLRRGGSASPAELAGLVGLDVTDPAIWASGIDALAEDLGEAERLAAELGLT